MVETSSEKAPFEMLSRNVPDFQRVFAVLPQVLSGKWFLVLLSKAHDPDGSGAGTSGKKFVNAVSDD
jgi:hypothetical protein